MPVYVGERYIPGAEEEVALGQAGEIRAVVQRLTTGGSPIRLLSTTFIPNEEWVFDLFEAETAEQVRQVYHECKVPVERVTQGVHLPGPEIDS